MNGGKEMKPEVEDEKCMRCGACVGTCPFNAIFLKEFTIDINDDCTECGMCVKVCPIDALDMRGD